jgi:hypothetical protein
LPAKNFREDIVHAREVGEADIGRIGTGSPGIGEVTIVSLPRALGSGSIDFAAVEPCALLRIA